MRFIHWLWRKWKLHLLFRCIADVDFTLNTVRFEFIRNGYIVAEQAVARHLTAHNPSQNGARMNSNSHLQNMGRFESLKMVNMRMKYQQMSTRIGCPSCVMCLEHVSIMRNAIHATLCASNEPGR